MSFFAKIRLVTIVLVGSICLVTSDPTTCDEYHFQCHQDGHCVFMLGLCNGQRDCSDDSDEKNCTNEYYPRCKKRYFQCENRACVPYAWRCDGENDCEDGSDESNCAGAVCTKPDEFECLQEKRCIHMTSRCDDKRDCADGSDERSCGTNYYRICNNQEFPCEEQEMCIPRRWLCDGENDCPEGSDEKKCEPKVEESCPENYCQQNAKCAAIRGQYYCNCPSSFTGEICETSLSAEKNTNHIQTVIGVSVTVVLLLIVITLTLVCHYKRSSSRRSTALMSKTESQVPFTSYSKE